MKKNILKLIWLSLSFGLFISCSTESEIIKTELEKNYWSRNDLVRMQLHGKVKTLEEVDLTTIFNSEGNMSSKIKRQYGATYLSDYYYTNSKLDSILTANIFTSDTIITRCYYEYHNEGKYVPETVTDFANNNRLISGLSAIKGEVNRILFDMLNDSIMQITHQYVDEYDKSIWHTSLQSIVLFSREYPKSIDCVSGFFNEFKYASNGMYRSYIKNQVQYTFLEDKEYLQLSEYVLSDKETYTVDYNEHRDLLTLISPESIFDWNLSRFITGKEYSDYIYDENENWISRKFRFKSEEKEWSEYTTETRIITYY